MSALIYSLLPYWAIQAIRRHRLAKTKLRLALREFKFHDLLSKGD